MNTVEPTDYIEWAVDSLYREVLEIKKLSSMSAVKHLNLFEMEKMFDDAMKAIQREAPSKEECASYHMKSLHSKLLLPNQNSLHIVKEIYACAVANDLLDEQMNWQEVSDAIDDFEYGDNVHGLSIERVREMIVQCARKLWHTKISSITFQEFIGQKITAIETDVHLTILFEKGALTIECPWRIRNADVILLGETDVNSNQREWKSVKELLVGKTIEDVQLLEQCPLLIVQCGEFFLDVFHASSFFDGWTLSDEDEFYIFSMHGGSIV
ncbi:hypothetical protein [Robertmurraya massiliosenegalensis]|uniref:hypothetical protein n=1 Tax=Robertmurraya massiliosenegalensis TaxID=1287657 RepID=UPI00030419E1|nr:hypothetical protein [Robertmurraya massiliosenegalensis]